MAAQPITQKAGSTAEDIRKQWQEALDKQQQETDAKLAKMQAEINAQANRQNSAPEPNTVANNRQQAYVPKAELRPRLHDSFWVLSLAVLIIVLIGAPAFYFTAFKPLAKTYAQQPAENWPDPDELIRPISARNSQGQIINPAPSSNDSTTKKQDTTQSTPAPNSRKVNFSWDYNGQKESAVISLNPAVDNAYSTNNANFNGDYDALYEHYLTKLPGDQTVSDLLKQLRAIARRRNLSDDQTVELTIKFVQTAISYDKERVKHLKDPGARANYPYETLARGMGVCIDKCLLLIDLLRGLGYGSALINLPKVDHAAVGLACTKGSDVYNSGYCYVETTNPFAIGEVPNALVGGIAQGASLSNSRANALAIGPASITNRRQGKIYTHINLPATMASR